MGPRPEGMIQFGSQGIKHVAVDPQSDMLFMSVKKNAREYRVVSMSMATVRTTRVGDMTRFPIGESDATELWSKSNYKHDGFTITQNNYQAAATSRPTPPTATSASAKPNGIQPKESDGSVSDGSGGSGEDKLPKEKKPVKGKKKCFW